MIPLRKKSTGYKTISRTDPGGAAGLEHCWHMLSYAVIIQASEDIDGLDDRLRSDSRRFFESDWFDRLCPDEYLHAIYEEMRARYLRRI